MTLTEFLLARIGEDEAAARSADGEHWLPTRGSKDSTADDPIDLVRVSGDPGPVPYLDDPFDYVNGDGTIASGINWHTGNHWNAVHIARWDPARVLAECEAKRRIVERYEQVLQARRAGTGDLGLAGGLLALLGVLKVLALPYADHPDYDESWRA